MIVVFDVDYWKTRYPEFVAMADALAQAYFDEATLYVDNSDGSPVTDATERKLLLNMVTAHLASINAVSASGRPAGRISSATEGSVSASFDLQVPGTAGWFGQTQHGFSYWQATAKYRMGRIYPGVNRATDPWQRMLGR